jgi:HK97 family phage major capsid protein/HK97 family phage prohead protease
LKTHRAYSLLSVNNVVKAVKAGSDTEQRIISGIATTPTPDRVGDIIDPAGVSFNNPLPLLWQHMHSMPVGTVVFGKATDKGIPFTATLPVVEEEGNLKQRVDEAWQSVKLGLVRAVSIGFRPIEFSFLDSGGVRFTETEVFELSLVTVPANAEATIDVVKSIDAKVIVAASGAKSVKAKEVTKSGRVVLTKSKENKLDYAKQIAEFLETKAAKIEAANALLEKSASATLTDEDSAEYDNLNVEIDSIDAHVKRLEQAQARSKASAVAVDTTKTAAAAAAARAGVHAVAKAPKLEKGIEFAQFAICLGAAKGSLLQAREIAQTRFVGNADLNVAIKAAVAAGTTTDATWAAPLVDTYQRFAGDFIEFLRPQTILGKFGTAGIPSLRRVPFNIEVAGQTSGGNGYWVGEGKPKPLTKFDYANVTLRWAKVANIAVLTEELLRFSNPSAEALVRDSLAAALIERLDIDFINPAKAAVANVSPASITNGVVGIPSSGNDAAAVRNDIAAVFGAYIAANMTPTSGVWIMQATTALALSLMQNPLGQSEFPGIGMNGGTLFGLPVIVSQYVAAGNVILANAQDIFLADDGQIMIDASREASLQMDNAPATQDATTGAGIELVSMFQTNSVAIRAERWINWQKRRAGAVVLLTGVAWGQPETP